MFACLKCYVACVRLRAKKYYAGQKRTTGGMNKTTVMEFFEACNALMAMPVLQRPSYYTTHPHYCTTPHHPTPHFTKPHFTSPHLTRLYSATPHTAKSIDMVIHPSSPPRRLKPHCSGNSSTTKSGNLRPTRRSITIIITITIISVTISHNHSTPSTSTQRPSIPS